MWEIFPEIIHQHSLASSGVVLLIIVLTTLVLKSIYSIGPTEVGLVRKRFGGRFRKTTPLPFTEKPGTRRTC